MRDMYQEVYIETSTGTLQGPFETDFDKGATEVWIFDESARLEEGFTLLHGIAHGSPRFVITSVRETRAQSPDGRVGALRRCLTIQPESGNIVDGLSRLIQKIDASRVDTNTKNDAKAALATALNNPLISAILDGEARSLLERIS